ncbi:hypothetical protein I6F35_10055 [Bradyrhizobium sp. BRP22]|uniref:hypothetical protein n=1 Tax=Bradyrhizobium sp. BRP22 TaxID=2793821 RepID=UPI001CD361D6|nr:hypothetical protein [Bradyrhizobium sp. BRP22]MCA1453555.1 hypothetical protein [Bradyrhizobium sp. BRP22]
MDTTLDNRLAERQIAEQLSNLARETGDSASTPTSVKASRAPLATTHQFVNWRHVVLICSLLAASIGVAWWWSSSAHTAIKTPSDPAPLAQAPPGAVAPPDASPSAVALYSVLAQQLQPMTRDLAALRQAVEQLQVRQEALVRDNENVASQLKAGQEEIARNKGIIDEIKATQIQMARKSQTLTERLNTTREQLARVIANTSAPKVMPEEPKASPEEPKVMPETPLPRPRPSANVAQMPKPKPVPPTAQPQAKNPQPSLIWPWSAR